MKSLYDHKQNNHLDSLHLSINHHGDSVNYQFRNGLPSNISNALNQMSKSVTLSSNNKLKISVCHSEPGAWHPANYHTSQCPPAEFFREPEVNTTYYKIGRTVCNN